jgi:lysophospholipase L1-like esterase
MAASLAVLLLAAGCGGGADPGPGDLWIVVGSSTAAGVGASPGRGWPQQLEARAATRDADVAVRARSGAVTYEALPVASPRPAGRPATDPSLDVDGALAARPAIVMLAFPTNDTAAGYTAAETIANLEALRARIAAAGATTVVLSSQPRDAFDAGQRARLAAIDAAMAQRAGDCFVDVAGGLAGPDGGIAPRYAAGDGVHLNDEGHAWVADRVWAVLASGRCVTLPAAGG